MGGWGLKHIHLLGKSLTTKSLWNLLIKDSLWKKVVEEKYIVPRSFPCKKSHKEYKECVKLVENIIFLFSHNWKQFHLEGKEWLTCKNRYYSYPTVYKYSIVTIWLSHFT